MAVKQRGTKRSVESIAKENLSSKKAKLQKQKQKQPEPKLSSDDEEDEESSSSSSESETESVSESEEDELDNVSEESESEDELDNLDNNSKNLKDDEIKNDVQAYDDNENNEDKKSSKEQHEEQKKLLGERKLKRKSGIEVERIKRLWEKLRVKTPPIPKQVRDKLCDEIWSLSKDVIGDLVLKHDASRVVQTLVKYCSKDRRDAVCQALKGNYYNLATSAYGKYLLIKLLHYGSKESRELILSELHGKLRKLMRHREGAYVVEDLYVLYATAKQRQQMIKEFWGSEYAFFRNTGDDKTIIEVCAASAEKRRLIASNLQGTIKASVEKGSTGFNILHAAMREYVQIFEGQEVRDFIELLQDQIAELVHTTEGCDVACTLIAKATAKERKAILKGLKSHADRLAKDDKGQIVLQTIFMTVDDTVLVNKTFSGEYKENMDVYMVNKFSRRPFIYLLNGLDKSYFNPLVLKDINKYLELSKETSKKDQDSRRKEILKSYLPTFYETILKDPYDLLSENLGAQFTSELLLNNDFPDLIKENREKLLDIIVDSVKGDLTKSTHLLNEPFTSRLLKTLIQGGKWNNKEKRVVQAEGLEEVLGESFAAKLVDDLFDNGSDEDALKSWIGHNQCAFVVVALLDSLGTDSKFGKKVKKMGKFIKKQEAENKGAVLLTKVLSL